MTGATKMKIGWLVLIAGLLLTFIVGFSIMESYALKQTDPEAGITLSQFIVNISRAWPPIVFLFGLIPGLIMGILVTHFWWPWVPAHMRAVCRKCGQIILLK